MYLKFRNDRLNIKLVKCYKIGINTTSPTQALTIDGGNNAKIAFLGGGFQSIYYGDSARLIGS